MWTPEQYQYYAKLFFWKSINNSLGTAFLTIACILSILGILLCIDYRIARKREGADREEVIKRNRPIYIFWFVLLLVAIICFVLFMITNKQIMDITVPVPNGWTMENNFA